MYLIGQDQLEEQVLLELDQEMTTLMGQAEVSVLFQFHSQRLNVMNSES